MDALRNILSPRPVSQTEQFFNFFSSGYNKGITWLHSNWQQYVTNNRALDNSLNLIKSFAWNNKEFIMGAAAVGTALLVMNYYRKNRPQQPIVDMQTSLNLGRLSIKTIKAERAPLNSTFTFCVDTSGSMNEENRLKIAKETLIKVIKNAQEVINNSSNSNIEITIIGFNDNPTTITKPTKLTPVNNNTQNNTCEEIIKQIETLQPSGNTNIIKALETSIEKVNRISKKNPTASHTILLLTDGEQEIDSQDTTRIQDQLIEIKSNFFAIGVGNKHNRKFLTQVTNSKKLNARYIDTTNSIETLGDEIFKIYKQTIAAFSDLKLTSSQLIPGSWSVSANKRFHQMNNEGSECYLGNLSENEELINTIEIHRDKHQSLSKVTFQLTFKDPNGRSGAITLPWKSDIIIPDIVNH